MFKGAASLLLNICLAAGVFLMVTIKEVHAYIEAGPVSFLIQMLIATGLGALFMLKVFWHNVTGKLSKFLATFKDAKARPE